MSFIILLLLILTAVPVLSKKHHESTDREDRLTVFIAGDSTVQSYGRELKPRAGWGQMIHRYFNSDVTFKNHAIRGRSSKSFLKEGRLRPILNKIKPNDYLLIQFGHNDARKNRLDLYTTVPQYKKYLKTYITEVRNKGAIPILITPVSRREYNHETGTFKRSFPEYVMGMKEVSKELNVLLVDLNLISVDYYNKLGEAATTSLFLHIKPGQYEAFPQGIKDDTHFQEYGAKQIAWLLSQEIKKMDTPLSKFVSKK